MAMASIAAAIRYIKGDVTHTFFLRTLPQLLLGALPQTPPPLKGRGLHFMKSAKHFTFRSLYTSMIMGSIIGFLWVFRYRNFDSSSLTLCFMSLQSRTRWFAQSSRAL